MKKTSPQPDLDALIRAILDSPSYRMAEQDIALLARPELRPVRMQLELLKPELAFQEHGVVSTIVLFGGTQIVERHQAEARLARAEVALAGSPGESRLERAVERARRIVGKCHYYDAAREFARLVTAASQQDERIHYVITTGGGPGVMEAGNRGAFDVGGKSIGLNIVLPAEQRPNPYITPELCFQFHYFALRKFHFVMRARALVAFPGGYGTLDEFFDALTLRQTSRMQQIPIILFGRDYWRQAINLQYLADEGVIDDSHLDLVSYADSPQEAWDVIRRFYGELS